MRILFVEPDQFLIKFYEAKLKNEFKCHIDLAVSGKEAIKLLNTEKPYDVIVTELYTPKGSGVDLLRFKRRNSIKGAFIFFCTVMEEIPANLGDVYKVDKFSFGLLCKEIKKSVLD
jgi:CheY-like chemotaxis protein